MISCAATHWGKLIQVGPSGHIVRCDNGESAQGRVRSGTQDTPTCALWQNLGRITLTTCTRGLAVSQG